MLNIRRYKDSDFDVVVALWDACGLLRPWNDPAKDIALCCATATSALFVGSRAHDSAADVLIATVMAGSDGHRGWMYYLAVDPLSQRRGFARAMVRHAEDWLSTLGIRKVELMIRVDNDEARGFYEKIGYQAEPRIVMSRWLNRDE